MRRSTDSSRTKKQLLACTPAIQPVSNKDLSRIASGFGYRIDPVYKTTKFHAGLDFAAPQGTPIYATANGTSSKWPAIRVTAMATMWSSTMAMAMEPCMGTCSG